MYKAGNITHAQKKVSSQLGHFPNAFCALIQTLKGETNVRKQGARVEVSAAPNVRRQRCCHFALVRVVVLSSSTVHLGFSEVGKSLQSQDSLINQRPSSEKFFKQRNLYLYVHRLLPNQRLTVLLYLIACFPSAAVVGGGGGAPAGGRPPRGGGGGGAAGAGGWLGGLGCPAR